MKTPRHEWLSDARLLQVRQSLRPLKPYEANLIADWASETISGAVGVDAAIKSFMADMQSHGWAEYEAVTSRGAVYAMMRHTDDALIFKPTYRAQCRRPPRAIPTLQLAKGKGLRSDYALVLQPFANTSRTDDLALLLEDDLGLSKAERLFGCDFDARNLAIWRNQPVAIDW